MKTKIQDMTSGSPGRLIILFAIPLMLGNICQQLYTMVDTMVVGQVAGVEALAALGAVDFLMWVVTGISTGLTQGFSIQLSQYYGAKDFENLRKSLAHSYRLTAFIAAGVLILSQSFASLVLTGLHTPSNIIGMSLLYLRIIFCGIPATAAYNMFASALRAMGNSKTPLTRNDHRICAECLTGHPFCGRLRMGCGRSSNRNCDRTELLRCLLFPDFTQN